MSFSFAKIFSSPVAARPSRVVGIDIGSSSVKIVELENTERAIMLRTYGELQLGPYAGESLGQAVTLDNKQQTEAVVDVLRESRAQSKKGVLAMPLSSSFMTVIPVSYSNESEMESRINIEAKKFIPLPLAEVTINWATLSPASGQESGVPEVLLAAIENRALGEYNLLLQSIGMPAEPSEIEVFSVVRALHNPNIPAMAIIDIGAKTTKLYLTRNGSLERVHRSAAGGAHVNQKLMQLLNVSFDEAENIKRDTSANAEHRRDLANSLVAVLESPLREFARLINRYETKIGTSIDKVMLCGGMSNVDLVPKIVEDILVKKTELSNPFTKVAYPIFMEDSIKSLAPSFSVALGAALRLYE